MNAENTFWLLPAHLKFVDLSALVSLEVGLRYFLLAGLAWLFAYVLFRKRWRTRKIIPRFPATSEVRRELLYSVLTLVIFGLIGAGTIWAARQGWTRLYWRLGDHGWVWFWCSLAITILLHDTYFYWTHRAMHHPRLFRAIHKVHHLSTNPSPWAAYSFSPLEAIVQAGIFPLVVMLVPIHILAFALFMTWQIVFNILGHTGFEFHPRWLMDTPLKYVLNTPTNHVMHHEKHRGNYGIYFNIWDRLMGTNHAEYESRYREVTGATKAPQPTPAGVNQRAELS